MRLPVGGPFSIAFNLRGINNLCLDAALHPEELAKMLMRLAENQAVLCRAVAKAGLDVAFFESAAAPPILSPKQFHELEMPALRRVLEIAADCRRPPRAVHHRAATPIRCSTTSSRRARTTSPATWRPTRPPLSSGSRAPIPR